MSNNGLSKHGRFFIEVLGKVKGYDYLMMPISKNHNTFPWILECKVIGTLICPNIVMFIFHIF